MSITKNLLSVIIINYNSTTKLNALIQSLNKIDTIVGEIIIIDNNSNDINKLNIKNPKIRLINNSQNLGFSKAVNQGITLSNNEIILLLNPDCLIVDTSPITTFELILNDINIGIAGGKIKSFDNKIKLNTATNKPDLLTGLFEFTNLKRIFPKNKYSIKFWVENNKISTPREVFSLCGAYLFIRKFHNQQINYMDEKYFLYLEDLDFGYLIKNNKQKAIFDPRSQIKHMGGGSNESKYHIVLKYWYKSRKIFFLKNLPKIQGYILYIIYSLEEIILKIYHKIINAPNE